jgi:hypothetical protein
MLTSAMAKRCCSNPTQQYPESGTQLRGRRVVEPMGLNRRMSANQDAVIDYSPSRSVRSIANASWNFAKVPVFPPDHATPRIDPGALEFGLARGSGHAERDGSLEDLSDDQDALSPSVFEAKPSRRGVHIRVPGGVPAGTTDYPNGIRWIQTIETNTPLFNQTSPYVDFIPPADDKPFYFSDPNERATFSDSPSRSANNVRWDATLSLAGVNGRTITRFDSVKYGFEIDAAGTLALHAPSSAGVASLVIHGDTLRSEYPDWNFSGGFAVPAVPAGSAASGTATA